MSIKGEIWFTIDDAPDQRGEVEAVITPDGMSITVTNPLWGKTYTITGRTLIVGYSGVSACKTVSAEWWRVEEADHSYFRGVWHEKGWGTFSIEIILDRQPEPC